MLTLNSTRKVRFCDGMTRRDFLHLGSLTAGAAGLPLLDLGKLQASGQAGETACILLFLVGGPSQLDTWDPKPHAPASVRGPFRPIQTRVPGIHVSEHFPLMAGMADQFAIVRSVYHRAAPIHETGHQLMQTGRLFQGDGEYPHYGAVVSHVRGPRRNMPPFVVLPGPIGNTGVNIGHGQGAGCLGPRHEPVFPPQAVSGIDPARMRIPRELVNAVDCLQRDWDSTRDHHRENPARRAMDQIFASNLRPAFDLADESPGLRNRYGSNTFGQSCLLARRLIERGVRLVTVNMFDTVFNRVTWDCHADGGMLGSSLEDYRRTLCPMFDAAYTTLLDDLRGRGLLDNTLVLAMGEFGRTPHLNPRGGRDHWPGVWSVLFAGGGVRGGQVIGASDRIAAEPALRPVSPPQIAASIYRALGIDPNTRLPGSDVSLVDAEPVRELFGSISSRPS